MRLGLEHDDKGGKKIGERELARQENMKRKESEALGGSKVHEIL